MLLDAYNQFSATQTVTATAISTNVIDLGPLGGLPTANLIRDIGAGEPLHLSILITTTVAATGGASTTVFSLESDSTADLATSATVHWSSASIAKATLVAGYWAAKGILIPPGSYERYLGVRYTVSTNDWTSGKVSAWLHKGRFDETQYRAGWSTGVN